MKSSIYSLLILFTLCPFAYAEVSSNDPHSQFTNVSPRQLDQEIKAGTAIAVDANGEKTRESEGCVPTSLKIRYDENWKLDLSSLPKDKNKKLVFYCANTKCTAAPLAAIEAKKIGYKNLYVMGEGIQGWKKANLKTEAYNP